MGPLTLGDITKDSQKAHLGLHSEVPLLRDVARVPKEVVEEAEVEEASPVDRSRSTVVDNRWYCIDCQTADQVRCLVRLGPQIILPTRLFSQ